MKYEIDFLKNGLELKETVESDNPYQAIIMITDKHHSWFRRNDIKILMVRCPDTRYTSLQLKGSYITDEGEIVIMQKIHHEGTDYETMSDQHGHHRYSRSQGRIVGRCTGSPIDDPKNISLGTFWINKENK